MKQDASKNRLMTATDLGPMAARLAYSPIIHEAV